MKWANKKYKNLNIYNVVIFLKRQRKTPRHFIVLHLCTKNLDYMTYSSRDIERDKLKLVILGHVLPFYLPKNLKNQNFEKMKKASGDVIILQMCTKNHDHVIYGSWEMECDRQSFSSFWVIFCHFTRNNKKKKKIPGDISF